MRPGKRPQVRTSEQGIDIVPSEFARSLQPLQLYPAIGNLEFWRIPQHRFHYRLILFTLQRARGVDKPPAGRKLVERRPQNCSLSRLKIIEICGRDPPYDGGS